jgi:hypothetical protein
MVARLGRSWDAVTVRLSARYVTIDLPESQRVVGQGDFWWQGLAMGRALVKPPEGNRRPGRGFWEG